MPTTEKKFTVPGKVSVPAACRDYGVVLEHSSRKYCDACLPIYKEGQATAFSTAGRVKMAELRAVGRNPSKGGEAKVKRGGKNSQHMREQAAWDAEHGSQADPEEFRREILPGLQTVSHEAIAKATELSEGYCPFIRRGLKVPHRWHWETLRHLATPAAPDG